MGPAGRVDHRHEYRIVARCTRVGVEIDLGVLFVEVARARDLLAMHRLECQRERQRAAGAERMSEV